MNFINKQIMEKAKESLNKTKETKEIEIKIKKEILTTKQVLDIPIEKDLWIVKDLIPKGCTFLSGRPKNYKTYLSLHIADCLTNEKLLFDKFEVVKKRVMVCDRENPKQAIKMRLKQLGIEKNKYPLFNFNRTPINSEGFKESFLKVLTEKNIEFIIFDSYRRFFIGDENSSEKAANFFAFIDQIKDLGIDILFLHHHRKENTYGKNELNESMRGSSDLSAYPDAHLAITKTINIVERQIKIFPVDLRIAIGLDPFIISVLNPTEETISFKFKLFEPKDEEKPIACQRDILEKCQNNKEKWFSRNNFKDFFEKQYGRDLIDKTLKQLQEDNKIKFKEGKKNKHWYSFNE